MADTWHELSHYESRDLVAELFTRAHDRELNAINSYAVVAGISQGRRYFESAAASDELVRPLLLYYGVVSLSRALVLFRSPNVGEEALRPAHGLNADGWPETLTRGAASLEARISRLSDLHVTTSSGTFADLAAATDNVDRAPVIHGGGGPMMVRAREGVSSYSPGTGFTLRDLLGRVPDLSTTFYKSFGTRGLCSPSLFKWNPNSRKVTISILRGVGGLLSEAEMRERLNLPPWVELPQGRTGPILTRDMRSLTIENATDLDLAALPTFCVDAEHNTFLVAYPPDAVRLSTLSALFAISYITSMLVRYHASVWFALVSRMKGDRLLPILREATDVIQARVPALVLAELESAVEAGDDSRAEG